MKFKKKNYKILKEIRIYSAWLKTFRLIKKYENDIYQIKYIKTFKSEKKKLRKLINKINYDISKSREYTSALLRKIEEKLNIISF